MTLVRLRPATDRRFSRRQTVPKVDPETQQPMTDDPDVADPDQRGGKREGDPGMEDAKPTGARGVKLGGK
jgi:hypothetical protein